MQPHVDEGDQDLDLTETEEELAQSLTGHLTRATYESVAEQAGADVDEILPSEQALKKGYLAQARKTISVLELGEEARQIEAILSSEVGDSLFEAVADTAVRASSFLESAVQVHYLQKMLGQKGEGDDGEDGAQPA